MENIKCEDFSFIEDSGINDNDAEDPLDTCDVFVKEEIKVEADDTEVDSPDEKINVRKRKARVESYDDFYVSSDEETRKKKTAKRKTKPDERFGIKPGDIDNPNKDSENKTDNGKGKTTKKKFVKYKMFDINCRNCNIKFTSQNDLTKHCRELHDCTFSCDLCEFSVRAHITGIKIILHSIFFNYVSIPD